MTCLSVTTCANIVLSGVERSGAEPGLYAPGAMLSKERGQWATDPASGPTTFDRPCMAPEPLLVIPASALRLLCDVFSRVAHVSDLSGV